MVKTTIHQNHVLIKEEEDLKDILTAYATAKH